MCIRDSFQSIGMAAHLNEQAAGRKILIVIAVVEQHRPCEAGEHAFHLILPAAGKAEVLFKIGQIAVHVCAADDHDPVSYTHLDVYKRQG